MCIRDSYADYGYKFSSDMLSSVNGDYTTGAYSKNVPNENVTWETSEQWNVGFDARFLNGRLGLNFDWYKDYKGLACSSSYE